MPPAHQCPLLHVPSCRGAGWGAEPLGADADAPASAGDAVPVSEVPIGDLLAPRIAAYDAEDAAEQRGADSKRDEQERAKNHELWAWKARSLSAWAPRGMG